MTHVYAIGTPSKQKIGYSANVQKRIASLQTGNPEGLKLHYAIEVPAERARAIERKIHDEYRHLKLTGEWFNMTPQFATSVLQHAAIRWTEDTLI